jgi:hypothetical protein
LSFASRHRLSAAFRISYWVTAGGLPGADAADAAGAYARARFHEVRMPATAW